MKYFSSFLFLLISFSTSFVGATACENIFSGLKKETPLYEGIQEVQKMIQFGKKLQAEKADAYTTHIPEFAQQINKHYEHIERIIESTHLKSQEVIKDSSKEVIKKSNEEVIKDSNELEKITNKQKEVLSSLKTEALLHAQNQRLTYAYWLYWNARLALSSSTNDLEDLESLKSESLFYYMNAEQIHTTFTKEIKDRDSVKISTTHYDRISNNEEDVRHPHKLEILNQKIEYLIYSRIKDFPQLVVLPTTEQMGIVALNQFESGITPAGLGDVDAWADGLEMNPFEFMRHDLQHQKLEFGHPHEKSYGWMNSSISKEEYRKEFFKIISEYPVEKKEQAEIAFFVQEHERYISVENMTSLVQKVAKEIMSDRYRFRDKKNLGQYLPSHINLDSEESVNSYLNEIIETYKQTVHQIEQNLSMNNSLATAS